MAHRMRFIVMLLGLALTFTARLATAATDAALAQTAEFSGTYQGIMANLPTALVLEQQGSALTGTMQPQNESPYTISGTVSGRMARGEMVYTRNGATFGFEARLNDSGLTWTTTLFGVPLPQTATDFQREGELAETKPHPSVPGGDRSREPADWARDQRLVGSWSYSESYTSGDFSVASEQFVAFEADGTYSLSRGGLAGGGSAGSFDTGSGGEISSGQWRTQDQILYIMEAGTTRWEPYGRYGLTDDQTTLMVTFPDGEKKIWERR